MGCGPVVRARGSLYGPLVATFGQLELAETNHCERCFGYSGPRWWLGFMGRGRENGHLLDLGHRVRHGAMVDVQRLARVTNRLSVRRAK